MISQSQYKELSARNERHKNWLGNRTSYRPEEVPAHCQISNEERSQIEIYEFVNNPPDHYFLYIHEEKKIATTWMGDKLGDVSFGRKFKVPNLGPFPSVRVPVRINAINGKSYFGTYYESSGNYVRVKMKKS